MILNNDVTRQCSGVRHDNVITQLAVVADMRISHEEIVIANPGRAAASGSSAVNVYILPEDIVISDCKKSLLTLEFQILWLKTDRRERIKLIAVADPCRSFHDDVRLETTSSPDLNARTDRTVWTDADVVSDLRLRTDDRRRMNHGC